MKHFGKCNADTHIVLHCEICGANDDFLPPKSELAALRRKSDKLQTFLDKNESDNYKMNKRCKVMEKALTEISNHETCKYDGCECNKRTAEEVLRLVRGEIKS